METLVLAVKQGVGEPSGRPHRAESDTFTLHYVHASLTDNQAKAARFSEAATTRRGPGSCNMLLDVRGGCSLTQCFHRSLLN